MATRRFIFKVFAVILIAVKDVKTIEVEMNPEISTTIGSSNTSLKCSYHTDNLVYNLAMYARNETLLSGLNSIHLSVDDRFFFRIATFYPPTTPKNATLTQAGIYLKGRVTLTNPTTSLPVAVLLLKNLHCDDNNEYICAVLYDRTGIPTTSVSNSTKITIKNPPKRPENITIVTSLSEIVDGHNVSIVCRGDVGNPPGQFIWKKYRYNDHIPETYSNIITTHEEVPGNCTYYGTSFLSVHVTSQDNKASFLCVEESLASLTSMELITGPINVYYNIRNVTVTRTPDMETYPADRTDQLNLTCNADGNPAPMYSWFREENPDNILSETNTLNINDLVVNKSGNYVCRAYNKINYYHYNETSKVNITIVDFPPDNEMKTKIDRTGDIFKFIGPALLLLVILLTVAVVCCIKRKRKNRAASSSNTSLRHVASEGVNYINLNITSLSESKNTVTDIDQNTVTNNQCSLESIVISCTNLLPVDNKEHWNSYQALTQHWKASSQHTYASTQKPNEYANTSGTDVTDSVINAPCNAYESLTDRQSEPHIYASTHKCHNNKQ